MTNRETIKRAIDEIPAIYLDGLYQIVIAMRDLDTPDLSQTKEITGQNLSRKLADAPERAPQGDFEKREPWS